MSKRGKIILAVVIGAFALLSIIGNSMDQPGSTPTPTGEPTNVNESCALSYANSEQPQVDPDGSYRDEWISQCVSTRSALVEAMHGR